MSEFLELLKVSGPLGAVIGLFVLVLVFFLSRTGVVVTKEQKQYANIVLSVLLAGVNLLNAQTNDVLVAAIASVGSALLYELIRWAGRQLPGANG